MKIINKLKVVRCRVFGHRPSGVITFQGGHVSCECDRCGKTLSVKVKKKKEVDVNDNNL